MVPYPLLFLSLVFLLFPLAHFRLIETMPIYLSEIPLLMVTGWLMASPQFVRSVKTFFLEEKQVVWGGILFFLGTLVPFFLKEVPLSSFGLFKSFIFLPLVLMVLLGLLARTALAQRFILFFWWIGILGSAFVGIMLLLAGTLTYDGRLTSLYASPNHFAMLLSPGILIGLFLYGTNSSKWRLLYALGTFLILSVLFATRSYASIGAVVFSSVLLWIPFKERMKWTWMKALLIGFFILGSWFYLESSTEKFQVLLDFTGRSSSASRLMIWESAWKISQENFPFGIGLGRFQETYLAYQQFFPPYLEWAVPEPHNLYLSLFLSTGLLGLMGFLLVVGSVGKRLWEARSQKNLPLFGRLYLSLIAWVLIVGLVDTPYFKNDLSFLFWGVIGLAIAFLASDQDKPTTD